MKFNDARISMSFILSSSKDTGITYNQVLMSAFGIVVLNALGAMVFNNIYHTAFHNGMKVRVAVCSLIYRKALRLSQMALSETSPGKMVNLLSNDVSRFDWTSYFMNYLWMGPLITLTIGCLMWIEIGFVGFIGILVIFTAVPILGIIMRFYAPIGPHFPLILILLNRCWRKVNIKVSPTNCVED